LSSLGKLDLLKHLFGRVTIPQAVYEELTERRSFERVDWIEVQQIRDRGVYGSLRLELDHGESEAIVLYSEQDMDLLLLDDGEARRFAEEREMKITGTGGLLILAKDRGLIDSVRPESDKLEREGAFRLSEAVKETLLRAAHERD
jgi:predicted nucleic acid-binding protein